MDVTTHTAPRPPNRAMFRSPSIRSCQLKEGVKARARRSPAASRSGEKCRSIAVASRTTATYAPRPAKKRYRRLTVGAAERALERRPEPLPLLLLLSHESDERWIRPDVVEKRITQKERVAGHPTIGYGAEPMDGRVRLVKQRVRDGDVVAGVMEVDVSLSFLDCGLDVL